MHGAQRFLAVLQEYVNGQLKNKFGDAFIRGNNGGTLCLPHAVCSLLSGKRGAESSLFVSAVLYISTVKS